VIFFEPKRIYNGPFDGYYDGRSSPGRGIPMQRGARRLLFHPARQGADRARGRGADRAGLWHDGPCRRGGAGRKGIDAEIIDLRTLVPLDIETIEASRWKRPAAA
jgi:2-oxoisovalerate dehydrogenase E1 component beta subunit